MKRKRGLSKQEELEAIRKAWGAFCEVYQELNANPEVDRNPKIENQQIASEHNKK